MRYAAIDIGSNAIRLLIADVVENKNQKATSFKKNILLRIPLRLGEDSFLDKKISDEKINDLLNTMYAFKYLMEIFKVQDYMACATSAMREAKNGPDIVNRILEKTGLNLEIINGQREANIIYAIHREQHLERKKNYLYIDVGGGSTELSFFSNNEMIASSSFNIGSIRILRNQAKAEIWKAIQDWIKEKISSYKEVIGVGTGGNINKLSEIADIKSNKPMSLGKLKKLNAYLSSYSLEERIQVLGLKQDRADVIIPASEIYLTLMKWARIKQLLVPRLGLVDGIIQHLVEKNQSSILPSNY